MSINVRRRYRSASLLAYLDASSGTITQRPGDRRAECLLDSQLFLGDTIGRADAAWRLVRAPGGQMY